MASSVWQHSINQHAIVIKEQATLMEDDLNKVQSRKLRKILAERREMIERQANKINNKPITPPLPSKEGVEPLAVNGFVYERVKQLWKNDPYVSTEQTTEFNLSENVTILISKEWLRHAFDQLVDNAVKAVENCPRHRITFSTRGKMGYAEILVSDTGPGLPTDIKEMIGRERIQDPERIRGMGMGLLMANTIVEAYGGEIYVGKSDSEGTTMVIKLPIDKG